MRRLALAALQLSRIPILLLLAATGLATAALGLALLALRGGSHAVLWLDRRREGGLQALRDARRLPELCPELYEPRVTHGPPPLPG